MSMMSSHFNHFSFEEKHLLTIAINSTDNEYDMFAFNHFSCGEDICSLGLFIAQITSMTYSPFQAMILDILGASAFV